MLAQDPPPRESSNPRGTVSAKLTLKDGRVSAGEREHRCAASQAVLIGKSVQPSALGSDSNIQLADSGELPLDATLVFSIRTQAPASFARDETVDVATEDESLGGVLSLANGTLALENSRWRWRRSLR